MKLISRTVTQGGGNITQPLVFFSRMVGKPLNHNSGNKKNPVIRMKGFSLPLDGSLPILLQKPKGSMQMTTTADDHHVIGSLGSDFWRIKVSPELVPKMAREFDWNRLGRRVMIDAREGIISWMNPSITHVGQASASDKVIPLAASILKLHVQDMRDLRWKGPDGHERVWLEADAAFYVGKNAETWYAIFRKGGQNAVETFEAKTPPDLVIEVEVTHFDRKKPQLYAEFGVRELWRVNASKGSERVQVEFLDLQAPGGPRKSDKSSVLGGLDSSILPQAFWLARTGDYRGLRELLEKYLVPSTNSEPEPESPPPSPSM